jgi:rRNA maturation endonuclease Nob1
MSFKYLCGNCLNYIDEVVLYIGEHMFCPDCGAHIDKYMEADEYEV